MTTALSVLSLRLRELIPRGRVKDFAAEIGMDLPQLMRYRSGTAKNLTLSTLERLAAGLEVPPALLITPPGSEQLSHLSRVAESLPPYGDQPVAPEYLRSRIGALLRTSEHLVAQLRRLHTDLGGVSGDA